MFRILKYIQYIAILTGICIESGAVAEPLPPAGVPALPRWTIMPRTEQSIPLSTTVFSADHPLWTFDLAKAGYVEEEYLIEGKANTYPAGTGWFADRFGFGRSDSVAKSNVRYVTRMIVRRPIDAANFSGTIFLEPIRDETEWYTTYLKAAPFFMRRGDIWVGFSMSKEDLSSHFQKYDAKRYAKLSIPDNSLRWDIMAQTAWLSRSPQGPLGKAGFIDHAKHVPGGLRVYSSGWSLTGCMQQYFINSGHHARARAPEGGPVIDGYLTGICPLSEPVQVPSDAPVIQVESENEYMPILTRLGGAAPARQSDGNGPRYRFRWYDIGGTSHIDLSDMPKHSVVWTQLGTYDANKAVTDCAEPTADVSGKDHFVPAMLSNLDRWVRFGEAPPPSATFLLNGDNSIRRDILGNAMGGVRPYWLAAPQGHVSPETDDSAAKKANPSTGLRVCGMLTHIEAMPEKDLRALYPTPDVMKATAEKQVEYLVKERYLLPEEAELDLAKIH